MKCGICGYEIRRAGTCGQLCRYTKKTGEMNRGHVCHAGCAARHYHDHHNKGNPRSLANLSTSR